MHPEVTMVLKILAETLADRVAELAGNIVLSFGFKPPVLGRSVQI